MSTVAETRRHLLEQAVLKRGLMNPRYTSDVTKSGRIIEDAFDRAASDLRELIAADLRPGSPKLDERREAIAAAAEAKIESVNGANAVAFQRADELRRKLTSTLIGVDAERDRSWDKEIYQRHTTMPEADRRMRLRGSEVTAEELQVLKSVPSVLRVGIVTDEELAAAFLRFNERRHPDAVQSLRDLEDYKTALELLMDEGRRAVRELLAEFPNLSPEPEPAPTYTRL